MQKASDSKKGIDESKYELMYITWKSLHQYQTCYTTDDSGLVGNPSLQLGCC